MQVQHDLVGRKGVIRGWGQYWVERLDAVVEPIRETLKQQLAEKRRVAQQQFAQARQHYYRSLWQVGLLGGVALLLSPLPGLWLIWRLQRGRLDSRQE